MNKIAIIFLSLVLFIKINAQENKSMIQITGPVGYRVYFNSELKGITNKESDGLTFFTNESIGCLSIKKQNDVIINIDLTIDKPVIEFNFSNYIDIETEVDELAPWKELFI